MSDREFVYTLPQVADYTGIPYPTLARYVSQYGDRIPHVGKGRQRRFSVKSILRVQQIRKETRPGRPPNTSRGGSKKSVPARDLDQRLEVLEDGLRDLTAEAEVTRLSMMGARSAEVRWPQGHRTEERTAELRGVSQQYGRLSGLVFYFRISGSYFLLFLFK